MEWMSKTLGPERFLVFNKKQQLVNTLPSLELTWVHSDKYQIKRENVTDEYTKLRLYDWVK